MGLFHHLEVVDLAAAERVTYFELLQILRTQILSFSSKEASKKSEKSIELAGWDRTRRLRNMAEESGNPEAALLICCSTAMPTVNGVKVHERSADKVCEAVLTEVKKHFDTEVRKLYEETNKVFEVWEKFKYDEPEDNPHFFSFIRSLLHHKVFGDLVSMATIDHVLGYARSGPCGDSLSTGLISAGPRGRQSSKDKEAAKPMRGTKIKSVQEDEKKAIQDESDEESTVESSDAEAASDEAETEDGSKNLDLKKLKGRIEFMNKAAANLTNISRSIVDHTRGIRFARTISDFVNDGHLPNCSKCGREPQSAKDVLIMGSCGHPSCVPCFDAKRAQKSLVAECIAEGCDASAPRLSALPLSELKTDTTYFEQPYGSKIGAVLELLQDGNRVQAKDHVLIFVQFAQLKKALIEALKATGITYLDSSTKNAVEKFKEGKATTCILDPESADAAGW